MAPRRMEGSVCAADDRSVIIPEAARISELLAVGVAIAVGIGFAELAAPHKSSGNKGTAERIQAALEHAPAAVGVSQPLAEGVSIVPRPDERPVRRAPWKLRRAWHAVAARQARRVRRERARSAAAGRRGGGGGGAASARQVRVLTERPARGSCPMCCGGRGGKRAIAGTSLRRPRCFAFARGGGGGQGPRNFNRKGSNRGNRRHPTPGTPQPTGERRRARPELGPRSPPEVTTFTSSSAETRDTASPSRHPPPGIKDRLHSPSEPTRRRSS